MNNTTKKAFKLLRDLKSVAFGTVDGDEPAVRIADVMMVGEEGITFTTARGKPYYEQLLKTQKVAICGMTPDYVMVRVTGDVKHYEDKEIVDAIFEHNPVLADLYPGDKRYILEGFVMTSGRGEIFDLSVTPPNRQRFAFGDTDITPSGYTISADCIVCGACAEACPPAVISEGEPFMIDDTRCLECGSCAEVCPVDAIESAQGL